MSQPNVDPAVVERVHRALGLVEKCTLCRGTGRWKRRTCPMSSCVFGTVSLSPADPVAALEAAAKKGCRPEGVRVMKPSRCTIPECRRKHIAKGLCRYHYEEKHRGKLSQTTVVRKGGSKVYEVPIPQSSQIGFYRDYKEPLTPLESGYGYKGVLLYDVSMRKVQCHFCGEWFQSLGTHITQHGLTGKTYKEEYGLMRSTALMGEPMREHAIGLGRSLQARMEADPLFKELQEKGRRNKKGGGRVATMEEKNSKGTCAAQLLAWLRANPDIGMHDKGSKSGPIVATFGSWNRARRLANIPIKHEQCDRTLALESLKSFAQQHGRPPYLSDCRRQLLPYSGSGYIRCFGSWRKAVVEAGLIPREKHTGGLKYAAYYDDWIRAYEHGKTVREIAASYRCHEGTVREALSKRGVWIPRTARRYATTVTPPSDALATPGPSPLHRAG